MKDFSFPPKRFLPRVRATFPDNITVELPEAKHFIQEDAPGEIAQAIINRFGNSDGPVSPGTTIVQQGSGNRERD